MPLNSMKDLLVSQLTELHAAERHGAELLPRLADSASDRTLANTLRAHATESKEHLVRLENAFEELGVRPPSARSESEGMKGLAKDCLTLAKMSKAEPHVRDAAIIGAVQHLEHSEIAGYGCARTWAKLLGMPAMASQLQLTLDDERHHDGSLSHLAESINQQAAAAAIA
jgi:ferritin-like metal-binding protein YciE